MKDIVYLLELKLVSFKNHNSLKLSFCKGFNGIAGLNGKGKTNLLDAIHYLTTGKSYFNFSDQQSIQTQADFTSIIGILNKQNENFEINFKINKFNNDFTIICEPPTVVIQYCMKFPKFKCWKMNF